MDVLINEILDRGFGREYYEFPTEWEENGLADLVRDIYKIKKYPKI